MNDSPATTPGSERPPVVLSDRTVTEVGRIMSAKQVPAGYGLRAGIRGGGCGATLILGFDKPRDQDRVYEQDGITLIIDRAHLLYVFGKTIDFVDGEEGRGFVFVDR
ncbi:MAG: iron-sulfur cluster assembly accessory protein [Cyclobacteriaceae bacterium]